MASPFTVRTFLSEWSVEGNVYDWFKKTIQVLHQAGCSYTIGNGLSSCSAKVPALIAKWKEDNAKAVMIMCCGLRPTDAAMVDYSSAYKSWDMLLKKYDLDQDMYWLPHTESPLYAYFNLFQVKKTIKESLAELSRLGVESNVLYALNFDEENDMFRLLQVLPSSYDKTRAQIRTASHNLTIEEKLEMLEAREKELISEEKLEAKHKGSQEKDWRLFATVEVQEAVNKADDTQSEDWNQSEIKDREESEKDQKRPHDCYMWSRTAGKWSCEDAKPSYGVREEQKSSTDKKDSAFGENQWGGWEAPEDRIRKPIDKLDRAPTPQTDEEYGCDESDWPSPSKSAEAKVPAQTRKASEGQDHVELTEKNATESSRKWSSTRAEASTASPEQAFATPILTPETTASHQAPTTRNEPAVPPKKTVYPAHSNGVFNQWTLPIPIRSHNTTAQVNGRYAAQTPHKTSPIPQPIGDNPRTCYTFHPIAQPGFSYSYCRPYPPYAPAPASSTARQPPTWPGLSYPGQEPYNPPQPRPVPANLVNTQPSARASAESAWRARLAERLSLEGGLDEVFRDYNDRAAAEPVPGTEEWYAKRGMRYSRGERK